MKKQKIKVEDILEMLRQQIKREELRAEHHLKLYKDFSHWAKHMERAKAFKEVFNYFTFQNSRKNVVFCLYATSGKGKSLHSKK